MAYVLSFITDLFDVALEDPNPLNPIAGQSVLRWLRAEFLKVQCRASEPDTEDWGWYMEVECGGAAYLVGASGDAREPDASVEWTIQVHRHRSLKDRLLRRNALAADDPLCSLIERLLRADPAIAQVEAGYEP